MKNQYFGDINDYVKYGLLRCLGTTGLRLGICWMLTPDDGRTDGRKIGYLSQPAFRRYDPELFDALAEAIRSPDGKNVHRFETSSLLPGTVFFGEVVPEDQGDRSRWFLCALTALADIDVLFLDPDNGLEAKTKPKGTRGSSKYLYWDEVTEIWHTGASLLLFQHYARENRQVHIRRLTDMLWESAPGVVIHTVETAHVLFLLACQPRHRDRIAQGLQLIAERWSDRVNISADRLPVNG